MIGQARRRAIGQARRRAIGQVGRRVIGQAWRRVIGQACRCGIGQAPRSQGEGWGCVRWRTPDSGVLGSQCWAGKLQPPPL